MTIAEFYGMFRVGPAPEGSTPFRKVDGRVIFDGQGGREIDYGHVFDRERGYRPFFKFRDEAASNTWGAESLLSWCESIEPQDHDQRSLRSVGRRLARQCIRMNREWERLGRPEQGLSLDPVGQA
jgi:hypothetical protein